MDKREEGFNPHTYQMMIKDFLAKKRKRKITWYTRSDEMDTHINDFIWNR